MAHLVNPTRNPRHWCYDLRTFTAHDASTAHLVNPTRNPRQWEEQRVAWGKAPRANRRAVAAWGWKSLTRPDKATSWPAYWAILQVNKGCLIN